MSKLADLFPQVEYSIASSRDDTGAGFRDSDVLFTFSDFLGPDSFKNSSHIRWVQSLGAGLDQMIDSPYLDDSVTFSSMRGIHGPQVSELAIMFMLVLSREYPRAMRNQSNKIWERWPGKSLQNKTIGILGTGSIGEALAKRCKAFDMQVVGITKTPRELNNFDEVITRHELIHAVKKMDYLVVLVPLNDETRNIVDRQIFKAMKPSAVLINLARGGIVNEADLLEALSDGEIAGAALDVFEQEPLPKNSPLWTQSNLILTPHLGGMIDVYVEKTLPILEHNIQAFLKGDNDKMLNLVKRT